MKIMMVNSRLCHFLAITALCIFLCRPVSAKGIISELEKLLFKLNPNFIKGSPQEKLMVVDWFWEDVMQRMAGNRPLNENGTKWPYKEYAFLDESNDDAARMNEQELLTRSGYKFETHDALAEDGYITVLTRIINPRADRSRLRQPPVLMEHGGTIDPTAYLIASSIQHHPEKWPRTARDGPMTSWNRSLAFVLANNGFDVWLAETRGANEKNKRRNIAKALISVNHNRENNMTMGESLDELMRHWTYDGFTMDDIIAHELKSHIDLVLKKTKSQKVHLFSFSLSTPTALGFLSIRPDYAAKVEGYVAMAPIISGEGANVVLKVFAQTICPHFPSMIGVFDPADLILNQPIRDLIILLSESKILRYSLVKSVTTLLLGPSPKYNTNLELNVMGHLFRHLTFRLLKQMCQQMSSDKLQKYDYGYLRNRLVYNSPTPPVYDISKLNLKEWIIVSAANDKLATQQVVSKLVEIVNPKPVATIVVPEYNHLDLIAGFENDRYVNLPILKYLQEMSNRYEHGMDLETAGARNFDLRSLLPPDFKPETLTETATNFTKSLSASLNLTQIFNVPETHPLVPLSKSFFEFFHGIGAKVLSGAFREFESKKSKE